MFALQVAQTFLTLTAEGTYSLRCQTRTHEVPFGIRKWRTWVLCSCILKPSVSDSDDLNRWVQLLPRRPGFMHRLKPAHSVISRADMVALLKNKIPSFARSGQSASYQKTSTSVKPHSIWWQQWDLGLKVVWCHPLCHTTKQFHTQT